MCRNRKSTRRVLVGAPTARDRSRLLIRKPGVVYFCPILLPDVPRLPSPNECYALSVDTDMNNQDCRACGGGTLYDPYRYKAFRDDSLLGFTVVAQPDGLRQAVVHLFVQSVYNNTQNMTNVSIYRQITSWKDTLPVKTFQGFQHTVSIIFIWKFKTRKRTQFNENVD